MNDHANISQVMTKICREAEASLDYYAMFKVWSDILCMWRGWLELWEMVITNDRCCYLYLFHLNTVFE